MMATLIWVHKDFAPHKNTQSLYSRLSRDESLKASEDYLFNLIDNISDDQLGPKNETCPFIVVGSGKYGTAVFGIAEIKAIKDARRHENGGEFSHS